LNIGSFFIGKEQRRKQLVKGKESREKEEYDQEKASEQNKSCYIIE
jgi:hypothetical protein